MVNSGPCEVHEWDTVTSVIPNSNQHNCAFATHFTCFIFGCTNDTNRLLLDFGVIAVDP